MTLARKRRRAAKQQNIVQWAERLKQKPTLEQCREYALANLPDDAKGNADKCAEILMQFWDAWMKHPAPYDLYH